MAGVLYAFLRGANDLYLSLLVLLMVEFLAKVVVSLDQEVRFKIQMGYLHDHYQVKLVVLVD